MVDLLDRRAFVGREHELSRLVALLAEVEAGSGRTAIVVGDAGIGKTRLLARFTEMAGERARVEIGACLPSGSGGLPYAPFVEVLRSIVESTEPARMPALLGPGRAVLARLLPEIAAREADIAATVDADPTAQVRLFELIRGVFDRLAGDHPLVLGIEDLQWADRSTRELLAYLVRALRDDRVLFLITVRSDDSAVDALPFVVELERDDGVERIDVEPFSRGEVAEQVGALLPDAALPALVDRLFERSDGNPFFVEELVLAGAADRADLPSVVRDVVAARLAGLSVPARDILRAATIGGRSVDEDLLARVLGLDGRALAAALREAVAAGVLERPAAGGGATTFRHSLLREAVERELFPTERASLHRAFAEAIESRVAGGRAAVAPAELARHWDGAGEPSRAIPPMLEAARAAESVFAWAEALQHWQRARTLIAGLANGEALAGMNLAELNGRAADAALLAGDGAAAVALGRAAIDAIDPAADPTLAGQLHNRLRWYLWESGDRRGAAEAVEAALRLIPAEPPSMGRAGALAQHAGVLLFAGRYRESIEAAESAIGLAREHAWPGELALALGVLGWDLAAIGEVDGGLARFREGQAIAATIGSAEGAAIAAINLVTLLDRVGRSREELDSALEWAAAMDGLGLTRTYGALILGYAAKAQFVLGAWDDLDRTTTSGLRRGASELAELWLSINRARLLVGRGRFAEAATLLERCRRIDQRLGGSEFRGPLLLAEAELAVWQGNLDAVRECGARGVELAVGGGVVDASLAWLAILVVRAEADASAAHAPASPGASLATQRLAEIEATVRGVLTERPELATGARSGAIRSILEAERRRLQGSPDPDLWHTVAAAWAGLERPYSAAYASFREAEATLTAHGAREAAGEALRSARARAVQLGALPLLAMIDELARSARLSIAEEAVPGSAAASALADGDADPYGFTPREREVLDLVADGRTNQQIAERLFITRKTASVHVSNVMAKLGAANRGEAAAMAHRLGLVD